MPHVAKHSMVVHMARINVTQQEMDAIVFFMSETLDKCASCENEKYLSDVNKATETVTALRHKFRTARNIEDMRHDFKKALKIARDRGVK